MISIKDNNGFCNPKNKYDQSAFNPNWMTKKEKAFLTSSGLLSISFQIIPPDTPIMINNTVHTGAKTQFGGLKIGFIKVGYQVEILCCVTLLDKKPTIKQVVTTSNILTFLFILFKFLTNVLNKFTYYFLK